MRGNRCIITGGDQDYFFGLVTTSVNPRGNLSLVASDRLLSGPLSSTFHRKWPASRAAVLLFLASSFRELSARTSNAPPYGCNSTTTRPFSLLARRRAWGVHRK